MSTLQIRKKSLKTWVHVDSVLGEFIISKFYFNADDNEFQIVEQGQSKRFKYSILNITLFDDTDSGTAETFPTIEELSLRLEELNYPAFNIDGAITSISGLIQAGTNVAITGFGTASSPYVISATGGGSSLTIYESGETPIVDVNEIEVIGATVTDDGSGKVTLEIEAGATPTLQEVTDESNLLSSGIDTLDNPVNIGQNITEDVDTTDGLYDYIRFVGSGAFDIVSGDANTGDLSRINGTSTLLTFISKLGLKFRSLGTYFSILKTTNLTADRTFEFPDKNGTFAMTDDIPSGGATDLGYTASPTNGTVTSSTGTDATIPLADGTNAGLTLNNLTNALKTAYDNAVTWVTNAGANIRGTVLTGISFATSTAVLATDTILQAIGKLQAQINNRLKYVVKNNTPSTALTGTTSETIISSYLIPANTFNTNDSLRIPSLAITKSGTAGVVTMRIKLNTTNSLSGANTILIQQNSSSTVWQKATKDYMITGGLLYGHALSTNITSGTDTGASSNTIASVSFNPAVDNYIIVSGQLTNSGDSVQQVQFLVTN